MGQITLICGAYCSDRSDRIDALWREHWGHALLLTPTRRLARQRQEAYVRKNALPGIWGNRAYELTAFAARLLEMSGARVRMVSRMERRLMVRQLLEKLAEDKTLPQFDITPGLIKHLLQLITQLKQAAVEPAMFRNIMTSGAGVTDVDLFAAAVYEQYQDALLAGQYYDVPGLYWAAESHCKQEVVALPENAEVLLLDEFDDFTPSQQRFMECLSHHVSSLVIGINHNSDSDQDGLFHLQRRWVEAFRERTDAEVVACPTDTPKSAVHHAASAMFRHSPGIIPAGYEENLQVRACADVQHELETIGRAVKQLILKEGIAPPAIAVALSDMPECRSMLASVFGDFGIPCRLPAPSLLSSAVGVVLSRLFDLLGKWEHQNLLALLTTPLLGETAEQRNAVMAFPMAARLCGALMGRQAWVTALSDLERRVGQNAVESRRDSLPAALTPEALTLFRQRFEMLAAFEDALPARASLEEYARRCDRFLTDSGMVEACRDSSEHGAALAALRALLQEFALDALADTALNPGEFADLLREGMAEASIAVESPAGAGVYCCGIDGLRCERYSHVFLGGLNEGVLPRPAPRNALYSDMDLHRLRRQGLALAGRSEHTYRERLLFYHAVCSAQKKLVLSWRKQDKTGRESLPSPFIVELLERFGKDSRVGCPDPAPDCFVPEAERVASPRDFANARAYRGVQAEGAIFSMIVAPVEMRAAVERERNSSKPFSIYDGVIEARDLKEHLEERFGPQAQFSVRNLEEYIKFPFNFFMNHLLRIRETEDPEGELDAMLSGMLFHEILQRFHEGYPGRGLGEILEEDPVTPVKVMAEILEEVFEDHRYQMKHIPGAVVRVEKKRFFHILRRYLDKCGYVDDTYVPCHFETAFGNAPREGQDRLSQREPFILTFDGCEYRFSGKIDRIDLNGNEARLIDYKTSSVPTPKSIKLGLSLQLTLYSWAVEDFLLPDCTVKEAYYIPLVKGKPRESLFEQKGADSAARQEVARARLAEAVAGIRSGYFPPQPDENYSDAQGSFHTAARYEEWRIALKCPDRNAPEDTDDTDD